MRRGEDGLKVDRGEMRGGMGGRLTSGMLKREREEERERERERARSTVHPSASRSLYSQSRAEQYSAVQCKTVQNSTLSTVLYSAAHNLNSLSLRAYNSKVRRLKSYCRNTHHTNQNMRKVSKERKGRGFLVRKVKRLSGANNEYGKGGGKGKGKGGGEGYNLMILHQIAFTMRDIWFRNQNIR